MKFASKDHKWDNLLWPEGILLVYWFKYVQANDSWAEYEEKRSQMIKELSSKEKTYSLSLVWFLVRYKVQIS